jgi:hypothetical protein
MTKILGLADILASLILLAFYYRLDIPRGLMIFIGIILVLKGVLFIVNFFSWIDLLAGIILIFSFTFISPYVSLGLAIFLALKGLVSLFTLS